MRKNAKERENEFFEKLKKQHLCLSVFICGSLFLFFKISVY